MKPKVICLRCRKVIKEKEKFYRIKLFDKGKEIAEDIVHYACWQNIFNPTEYIKQAMHIAQPMIQGVLSQIKQAEGDEKWKPQVMM